MDLSGIPLSHRGHKRIQNLLKYRYARRNKIKEELQQIEREIDELLTKQEEFNQVSGLSE